MSPARVLPCALLLACGYAWKSPDPLPGVYCSDLCRADPTLFGPEPDAATCTTACETDPAITQSLLDCIGSPEFSEPEALVARRATCQALLGTDTSGPPDTDVSTDTDLDTDTVPTTTLPTTPLLTLTVQADGTPAADARVGAVRLHGVELATATVGELVAAVPLEATTTLDLPAPTDFDAVPDGGSGAWYVVFAWHDLDGDGAWTAAEPIIGASSVAPLFTVPTDTGVNPWSAVLFQPVTLQTTLVPYVTLSLPGWTAGTVDLVGGAPDLAGPATRLAGLTWSDFSRGAIAGTGSFDQALTDPFEVALSDAPVDAARETLVEPVVGSVDLEVPTALDDADGNGAANAGDPFAGYTCMGGRLIAALYVPWPTDPRVALALSADRWGPGWQGVILSGPGEGYEPLADTLSAYYLANAVVTPSPDCLQ